MKAITFFAAALSAGCSALPPSPPHYTVIADVYVRDEAKLCRRAWDVALREFGPGVAERVTMIQGHFDTARCLAVLYQCGAPEEIVSAGIEVTRAK